MKFFIFKVLVKIETFPKIINCTLSLNLGFYLTLYLTYFKRLKYGKIISNIRSLCDNLEIITLLNDAVYCSEISKRLRFLCFSFNKKEPRHRHNEPRPGWGISRINQLFGVSFWNLKNLLSLPSLSFFFWDR